jgi:hypothetical protein
MTLGEIHELIIKLDDLVFKAETGQHSVSWDEYQDLKNKADKLVNALARGISEAKGCTFEEAYAQREELRSMARLEAMISRHLELNPESSSKKEPLLIAAFQNRDNEAFKKYLEQFDYLFDNAPRPPAEPTRKGIFERLFKRR